MSIKKKDLLEVTKPQLHIFGELPIEEDLKLPESDICTRLVLQLKTDQLWAKIGQLSEKVEGSGNDPLLWFEGNEEKEDED